MTVSVIKLINEIIMLNGIKKYTKNWTSMDVNTKFEDFDHFIGYIKKNIKMYHKHSNLLTLQYYSDLNKLSDNRKSPKFFWDKRTRIGRIIFFHFYTSNNNKNNMEDENDIVTITHKHLNEWINNNMNGLIIDLRFHKGGNFYPFTKSLNLILGNTTLFSWNKEKTENTDNKWINIINNNLEVSNFYSSELSFKKPIAIIIGNKTLSSGEFSAAIFYGRDNVKFFGNETGGLLSMNSTTVINNKLKLIIPTNLTTSVNGYFHESEHIKPDIITNQPIKKAKQWIKNQSKINNFDICI